MRLGTGIIGGAKKFPTVEASVTSFTATNQTTHVIALPSGIVSGQLLIIMLATQNPKAGDPAGWSPLFATTSSSGSNQACLAGWYRVADGSEGGSVNVTLSFQSVGAANAWRIKGGRTPEAASAPIVNAPDPPSLSPSWGTEKTLWIAAAGSRGTGNQSITGFPSGYSGAIQTTGYNGAVSACCGSCWRQSEAASEDPGSFSTSINFFDVATTIAIRPK